MFWAALSIDLKWREVYVFFFKFRYLVDAPEDEQRRITEGKTTYRVLELYDEVLTTPDRYRCLNINNESEKCLNRVAVPLTFAIKWVSYEILVGGWAGLEHRQWTNYVGSLHLLSRTYAYARWTATTDLITYLFVNSSR